MQSNLTLTHLWLNEKNHCGRKIRENVLQMSVVCAVGNVPSMLWRMLCEVVWMV